MSDFDSIRAFNRDEFPQKLRELLDDKDFIRAIDSSIGWLRRKIMFHIAGGCSNVEELQERIVAPAISGMLKKQGCTLTADFSSMPSISGQCVFISNHRDIVLDPTLLAYLLVSNGGKGMGIAIGDNLLIHPWIENLVRLNRSFIVKRSITSQSEFLDFSKLLSAHIHDIISSGAYQIWIAQREGRAKDSNDLTQRSLLKMLSMSDGNDVAQSLESLHITPLAISYEYDPCDWLKAMEFQMKRDNPDYVKTRENDLLNMKTGIFGHKGRVHLQTAACIDSQIEALDKSLPRNTLLDSIAGIIDRGIHSCYRIYPGNRIALDILKNDNTQARYYTKEDRATFEGYMEGQLSKITLKNPDMDFLRTKFLEMYANPLINHLKATQA